MEKEIKDKLLLTATGILAGVANGFFGGGGGMLVVPMLTLLLKRETKRAHATAILIILPITIISGIIYAMFGSFDMGVGLPSGAGVVVGGIVGAFLLKKIKSGIVGKIFAFVILAAGVKMLFF